MADQITEDSLKDALRAKLQAVAVEVTDVSGEFCILYLYRGSRTPIRTVLTVSIGGCGQAFTAVIVSPQFNGLNRLKRHRLVNTALKDEIANIHAWSAKCHTPDEWEKTGAAGKTQDAAITDA